MESSKKRKMTVKVASVWPVTVKMTQFTDDYGKTKLVANERESCAMVANEREVLRKGSLAIANLMSLIIAKDFWLTSYTYLPMRPMPLCQSL
jgi:hypothetical protein